MLLPNRMRKLLPKLRIRFSLTPAALCWRRAALRSGHRAIELKPDYAAAYLPDANQAQAEIYEKLGQRDKVIADYHQALSLAPNMTSAQDRLNSFKSRSAPNRSMAHEIGSSGVKIIMKTKFKLHLACLALVILAFTSPSMADTEKRIAFVVGNSAYQAGQLATSANDAGLIAQTLQAAGFDVTGARDLDGESLRAAFRDFLDKAQASGPDTMAFVYLAGYGLQLDGENYFVPVDAKIASAQDVAVEALRVSDYTKRLAGLPLKASLIVLDAARDTPFAKSGPPLAGGLALADAEPNMLVAFNATPGTVAPTESGPYGAYARALTEMIREGGLPAPDVFDGVRLRVNEETKGAFVPWDASRITAPFVFFVLEADAPPPALTAERVDAMRAQPLRDLGAQDAYAAAIERDTLQGYEEFLAAYPSDPLANRVRALLSGFRDKAAVSVARFAQLIADAPQWFDAAAWLGELDLNPIFDKLLTTKSARQWKRSPPIPPLFLSRSKRAAK